MKKTLVLLLTCLIICTAFNKPLVLLTDYRDAYVGNYFCHSSCQVFNIPENGQITNRDTLTIAVEKDPLDSILLITIEQRNYQVKLKSSGLFPFPDGAHRGGKFFANDSLTFFSFLGLGGSCSYRGKKQ